MTDTVDDIVSQLRAAVDRELAVACERLRALGARQPATAGRRYKKAAEAFGDYFEFDDQKVRRICRKNAVDAASGHRFAQLIEGTWHVVEPEFSIWRERFERSEAPE